MKPKQNYKDQPDRDRCQTPPHAFRPLIRYLDAIPNERTNGLVIWEPACGECYLYEEICNHFVCYGSDILNGHDFFQFKDWLVNYDVIVTNPPFSQKYKWIAQCYELSKPWALLMPLETLGAKRAQEQFKEKGMELIVLNRRVNFKMPNKGWEGSAQFPVAWFTHGLNIGRDITYAELPKVVPPIDR